MFGKNNSFALIRRVERDWDFLLLDYQRREAYSSFGSHFRLAQEDGQYRQNSLQENTLEFIK